jgi:ferric-dicitrate binding protein FerR (iron transport regulator)
MKIRLIIFMLISTAIAGPAMAQGTGGRLVSVSGTVWTQAPGAEEIRARVGEQLEPGTKIRTAAESQAEVAFEDGSILVVQSQSSLVLSGIKRQQKKKTSILIFFGRIWNKVSRKLGDRVSYEVNTPIVVCGVRGTEFEAAVGEDGSVRIWVGQGVVNVSDVDRHKTLNAGEEVEADVDSVGEVDAAEDQPDWEQWRSRKRERVRQQGRNIIDKFKNRILSRRERLEELRKQQEEIEALRKQAIERARAGDSEAIEEIRKYNQQLVDIADAIADLGDAAGSQFGLVDHFADLATDPRFNMIDGKYVAAEAAGMRRIKAMFDKMIAEGTDISMEAMEKMLREMSDGQRGSLKFPKGSSADDLWGEDEKDSKQ